jgi:hypothetical protein
VNVGHTTALWILTGPAASYLIQAAERNLRHIPTATLKANTLMPFKHHNFIEKLPNIDEGYVIIDMNHSTGANRSRSPKVPERTLVTSSTINFLSITSSASKMDSKYASTTSNRMKNPLYSKPSTSQSEAHPSTETLRLYNLAYTNRWRRRELYHQIAPFPPVFLYCSLMLPWVTATVINAKPEEVASFMTAATLSDFSRAMGKFEQRPTIVAKKGGEVWGILLASLKHWALKKIEEYVGMMNHKRDTLEVEIATESGEKIVVVAYVFVWSGEKGVLEDTDWSPEKYMKSTA